MNRRVTRSTSALQFLFAHQMANATARSIPPTPQIIHTVIVFTRRHDSCFVFDFSSLAVALLKDIKVTLCGFKMQRL